MIRFVSSSHDTSHRWTGERHFLAQEKCATEHPGQRFILRPRCTALASENAVLPERSMSMTPFELSCMSVSITVGYPEQVVTPPLDSYYAPRLPVNTSVCALYLAAEVASVGRKRRERVSTDRI